MDNSLPFFILAGFIAQMIDGTLGMAYGVSCSTLMLSIGVSPVVASASVHMAELFTTAVSAFCHLKAGNVDKEFLKRLVIPGVIGGIIGAYILCNVNGEAIKPFISLYLLGMGILILVKAARKHQPEPKRNHIGRLGFLGGFVDAVGGGGWGPVVTSTLVAKGNSPRFVIGSVNVAEFFVAAATSAVFLVSLGSIYLNAVIGLVIGGMIAAPIAAKACKSVQPKPLMVAVGILIVCLSVRTIYQTAGSTLIATQNAAIAGLNALPH
ncbi:MAG TPA: sulfite exporter TauE/SafE family protein [Candidatus Melainabacteria bacterium]|nr:sulfite exporter TauE/SafE family protein [Candidatus Melainabacteria bacterium]HIN66505.1 sulfite exporter TauE/SafE family protein [Candidatus Obscuribacterales bacterium]